MKPIIFYILFFTGVCTAQQLIVKTNSGTQAIPASNAVTASVLDDKAVVVKQQPVHAERFIIELDAPSLLQQKKMKTASIQSFQMQKDQVRQKILSMQSVTVGREFSTVLSGFTVTGDRNTIESLRSTIGVKNIYEDIIVSAVPSMSSASAQTDQTSTTHFSTGKGVKVGIIDTGIDYMHEALGTGFGKGYKVAGGYDFINNDSDPMDDNGHGTHVAGIVAGKSETLNSIGSDATLFAYKALDAQGNGNASDVIAAIEQAIADSVDVINLSLGSADGDPNDVLSLAVDRAVEAGIVVVVAAGNAGDFQTIHSPGVAKNALTVGAADNFSIASFSSKGPVPSEYDIKPDVVAPGVGILSAKNGGGYVEMSGTSMATPYVTGIAAALKQLHPSWTAFEIRDAIISNATDLSTSLFSQGNGEVSENQSLHTEKIVSPAHLTFGFDLPSEQSWTKSDTITIYNMSAKNKSYQFQYQSKNPAMKIQFSQQQVEIAAQSSATIVVELTTDNMLLSDNKNFADGYTGKIYGYGNIDTVDIPFTFFKGNVVNVQFSETPCQVLIHNRKNFSTTIAPKTNNLSVVVNQGNYDIVTAFFDSYYVVKENILVNGYSNLSVNKEEATHTVKINPSDESGNPMDLQNTSGVFSFIEGILYQPVGYMYVGMGGGSINQLPSPIKHFSSMSGNYEFGYSLHLQPDTQHSYTFDVGLDSGIESDSAIIFHSGDIRKVEMKYDIDVSTDKVFPISWSSFITSSNVVSVTYYNGNDEPLRYPFIQTSFYNNYTSRFPIFHSREAYSY